MKRNGEEEQSEGWEKRKEMDVKGVRDMMSNERNGYGIDME